MELRCVVTPARQEYALEKDEPLHNISETQTEGRKAARPTHAMTSDQMMKNKDAAEAPPDEGVAFCDNTADAIAAPSPRAELNHAATRDGRSEYFCVDSSVASPSPSS